MGGKQRSAPPRAPLQTDSNDRKNAGDDALPAPTFWHEATPYLYWAVIVFTLGFRLNQVVIMPSNTGDVVRNLFYGNAVVQGGLEMAGRPLTELDRLASQAAWGSLPYNYPPLALGFFTLISAVWPCVFFAKLCLTGLEAINALLLARFTGDGRLGLIYWALPMSWWWVSREGQFEPVQNVFVLGGLCLLARRRPAMAMAMLTLAVQVKLTAVLMLPYFVVQIWRHHPRKALLLAFAASVVALAPTAIAQMHYPCIQQLFTLPLRFNPYYWNPFDPNIFIWMPGWLIWLLAGMITALLAGAIVYAIRFRAGVESSATVLYLLTLRIARQGQFWYLLVLPTFLAVISHRRVRYVLFLCLLVIDPYAITEIIDGPWGYVQHFLVRIFDPIVIFPGSLGK